MVAIVYSTFYIVCYKAVIANFPCLMPKRGIIYGSFHVLFRPIPTVNVGHQDRASEFAQERAVRFSVSDIDLEHTKVHLE